MNKRIVITHRSTVDLIGGVNTFVFELGAAFIRLGYNVDIITYTSHMPKSFYSEIYNIPINEIPRIICLNRRQPAWPPKTSLKDMFLWFILGSRKVFKDNPVLVIVNGVVPLLKIGRSSTVISVNHGIVGCSSMERLILRTLYEKNCDHAVAVSNKAADEMSLYYNINRKKITTIPLGIRISSGPETAVPHPFGERENAIIHVGTSEGKNLPTTLKIYTLLQKRLQQKIKLYIVGTYEEYVRRCLSESNLYLGDGIEYFNSISRKRLFALFAKVKVFVSPSFYEALPYAVIEAMSMGSVPVVSYGISPELVIQGENGYRVKDAFDSESFVKFIEQLLNKEEMWEKMSKKATLFARNFDCDKIAKAYLDLIKQ